MEVESRDIRFPSVYEEAIKHIINQDRHYIILEGGRAGGKTTEVAEALTILAMNKKIRIVACREFQNTTSESVREAFAGAIERNKFPGWSVKETKIEYLNGSKIIFKGLRTSESKGAIDAQRVKSLENVDVVWCEEAQSLSREVLDVLTPTIRKEKSMLIFTANRLSVHDPYRMKLVEPYVGENNLPDAKPYDDGKRFIQKVLSTDIESYLSEATKDERNSLQVLDPENYRHVWLGEPLSESSGGIFSKQLAEARTKGHIGQYPYRQDHEVYAAFDLGVSDATAIWLYQIIEGAIYFLKYIEDFGRPIANYFMDLKDLGYRYGEIYLPHDAEARSNRAGTVDQVKATTLVEDLQKMLPEFRFKVLPRNQNYRGIDLARGMFSTFFFDAKGCEVGLQRLSGYRYDYSVKNKIWSQHPRHDENSHGADAFQYACMAIKDAQTQVVEQSTINFQPFVPKEFGY